MSIALASASESLLKISAFGSIGQLLAEAENLRVLQHHLVRRQVVAEPLERLRRLLVAGEAFGRFAAAHQITQPVRDVGQVAQRARQVPFEDFAV